MNTFRKLKLVTLTVDHALFRSPADAFLYMKRERCVARLLRELRRLGKKDGWFSSDKFVFVYEFQKGGWPHVHLLLDASFIPAHEIERLWALHHPDGRIGDAASRPPFGIVHMKTVPTSEEAMDRLVAYVSKLPKDEDLEWLCTLAEETRVVLFGSNRVRGKKVVAARSPVLTNTSPPKKGSRSRFRGRHLECGQRVEVMRAVSWPDLVTGELKEGYEWLGELDVTYDELSCVEMPDGGGLPSITAESLGDTVDQLQYLLQRPVRVLRFKRRAKPRSPAGPARSADDDCWPQTRPGD